MFLSLFSLVHAAPTVCAIPNGCTGTSTAPAYGKLLIGGKNGEYEYVASSTLSAFAPVQSVFGRTGAVTAQSGDYTTSLIPEGPNLYWTQGRFDSALSATTSLPNILTLGSLALPVSQLTGILPVVKGGTASSSAVTNGIYYNNGSWAEADNFLTYDTSNGIRAANASGNSIIQLKPGSSAPTLLISNFASTGIGGITWSSTSNLTWQFGNTRSNAGTSAFVFGGPGIGGSSVAAIGINATSTPGALLSIAGSTGGTTQLVAVSTSTSAGATSTVFAIDLNGTLSTALNGAQAYFNPNAIVNTGVVGINTNAPNAPLTVVASSGQTILRIRANNNSGTAIFGFRNSTSEGSNTADIRSDRTNSPSAGDTALEFFNTKSGVLSESGRFDTAGDFAVGSTTPVANFQVAASSTNATTTAEIGKSGQNKGSCLKLYRTDGSAIYAYVAAGATTFTLTTTACASVSGF